MHYFQEQSAYIVNVNAYNLDMMTEVRTHDILGVGETIH